MRKPFKQPQRLDGAGFVEFSEPPNSETHQPKNSTTVWLAIFADGTTSYGYPTEAAARRFADEDNTTPVIAVTQTTIMYTPEPNPS